MPPSLAIAVLLLGVLALETHRSASALHIEQAFASPNQTNNFVVDPVSRKVYLATVNTVYQLNGTLSVEVEKRTGPVEDNLLCHAPQLPQAPCEHPKSLTDNYNKLLKLDREQGVVVVCGSVYQGFCELRKMENISEIAVEFPPQGEKTVFPSMLNIAANHPNASTVGLIFRSHGGNTRLLVGATYTGAGTQFFPKNHSKEDLRFENTPEIAIRSLNIKDLSRLFTYDINPSEDNVFKIKQEVKTKNKLNFVHAFIQKTYSYIAFNNDAKMGHKESQPNSILARICLDTENPKKPSGPESKKLTESYIQMPLQCGFNGNIYNRLLSVYPAEIHGDDGRSSEPYLFGVFSKGDRKSALCAFKFEDIEEEIRQGRRSCSNSPSSDVQVLDSVIQGSGAACVQKGTLVLQREQLDCGAAHLQHPLALRRPLRAIPLVEYLGLTSVSVDYVHNHTVVFLGTTNGRLRKLTLLANMTLANQWTLKLPAIEAVHHIMTFDPSDSNFLYLMTSHHMLRVKVAECDQWKSCSDCLGAGDAHCGWCTLENRCTIQKECAQELLARSWISMGEGPQQCPSMTLTPPEISISADIKDVGILINGSVPDLDGSRVECEYGPGVSTAATVHLDYGPAQIQTCPLLPRENYQAIPSGTDHLTVSVAIKVNGTSVVSGSFIIYDCEKTGAIHPKTSCVSCLSTRWKCYWDQENHLCVSKDDSKHNLLENAASCPSLVASEVPPSPSGMAQDFTLSLSNIQEGEELECDFGTEQQYEATWLNSSTVKCSGVTLSTNQRSQIYHLNLRRRGYFSGRGEDIFVDSPQPMRVEVYNCKVGSSDCSQCWGREDQGHLCGWCENSCRPRDDCQPISDQCPSPEIHKIYPLRGPVEGGTLLTVQGRNLGRRAEAVKVSIGGVPCTLQPELYTVSVELVCVTGSSSHDRTDIVQLDVVQGGKGKSKESFSYLVPKLLSMNPRKGSRAGGTRVSIQGEHLDIGSQIKVMVNNTLECIIIEKRDETIECTMPQALQPHTDSVAVCVEFENVPCQSELSTTYTYEKNPIISFIHPQKSYLSGGRIITVTGQGFDLVQSVTMQVLGIGQTPCKVDSNSMISCLSHASSQSQLTSVQFFLNGVLYTGDSPSSFDSDEEEEEYQKGHFRLEYVEDPQFFTANKEKLIKHHPGEPLTLIINKGPSDLELVPEEYSVMIGPYPCNISFHNDQLFHCTISGLLSSSERELPVIVQVGNFRHTIAKVQLGGSELAIVVSIVVCCVLLLLCTVALVVYCTKSRRAERYWQKTLLQMEEMESQIREEIRKGFAELQTDMTDLTKELNRSQGIPFLEYKQFVTRTFFPKMCSDYEKSLVQPAYENDGLGPRALPETHPLLQDWQATNSTRPNIEEGITLFSTLLNNKHFLITFVHALEQQKDFAVRDRCSLASLLTIALHGKLEYYTSIMKDLLVDLIDASASKNPKLMLRRTESVVEKMLTNWMSICMYSYLKETVGEPFFLLLCAIKQQINKGSIDAITGKARYTLNEEWLLRENVEAKPQNMNVSFQGCGMDSLSVRVMHTDTICQVKEKILEAFYKNLPFSQWPRAEDVDLEWFDSGSNSKLLQDLDNSSVMEDGRKKLNTVFHYQIPEGASLAMSLKDKKENTLGRVKDLDTEKYVHLVLPHDELMETKKSHRQSHRKKVLPEIYLTRLLSTKGTLQKFLDDLFQAILSIPPDRPPLAVKYFFDFLEEQADKRGITDPDTLHIWKTNSLPLRFWVNILKNPQFVFDIDKTDHMDACLSVIAQAFIDACSISDLQLGKDSPTNKLLYAKEIPEYKKRVQCYYQQIQEMAPLSEQEMNAHLAEESRKYRNEFNTNLALTEIYKYAKRYRNQVVSALESNPTARRTQLHHKFEQVIALVEDNIYECCSEA
ncbi:Plexin-D1 Precursor [Larimichthys crocea]|uniref:Plexin-D1 n=1 Tax=Larimichthys crocea TaxID=215358 RepID=A0A6G0IQ50_LARCR|nr:plexin-D1 [Larimichthys crocea]KAE8293639.1 Plexin-D1 Precursor [Larimichthys crocea]